jgi:hypothetical protein
MIQLLTNCSLNYPWQRFSILQVANMVETNQKLAETADGGAGQAVTTAQSTVNLPRIAIMFCTRCKWNLRAAYVSQPKYRRKVIRNLVFTPSAALVWR